MSTMANTKPQGPRKLRAWRESHGYNQTAAARRLGVHQNSVCEWEAGKKAPRTARALYLAAVTGGAVSPEDWLTGDELEALVEARRVAAAPVAA